MERKIDCNFKIVIGHDKAHSLRPLMNSLKFMSASVLWSSRRKTRRARSSVFCAAGPGEEQCKQHFELLQIDAVLLQVRQARVVPAHGVTGAAPVTAGQMLSLRVINHAQVMTLMLYSQWIWSLYVEMWTHLRWAVITTNVFHLFYCLPGKNIFWLFTTTDCMMWGVTGIGQDEFKI